MTLWQMWLGKRSDKSYILQYKSKDIYLIFHTLNKLELKEGQLTVIQEILNHFDKEYCFRLVKTMPEKIKPFLNLKE